MSEENAEGRMMRICNYVFIPRAGIRLSRRASASNFNLLSRFDSIHLRTLKKLLPQVVLRSTQTLP